jgi:putative ABC transport system substrate-binding protein
MADAPTRNRPTRRWFVRSASLAGLAVLAGCGRLSLPGQQASPPRLGFLASGSQEGRAQFIQSLLQGLSEQGYVEGRNVVLEYRFSDGDDDRLPALAAELVALPVALIVASGTPATVAAKQATSTIPIVMGASADPVESGLVASMARPGGNVTGMAMLSAPLMAKRLELLREALPHLSRLATFSNSTNPAHVAQANALASAAGALDLPVQSLEVQRPEDFARAFDLATAAQADALIVPADTLTTNYRARITELAASYRLPAMYDFREFVDAGGLMSYGPTVSDLYRRAASYVGRILKGARPADLPVEQPLLFNLVVNQKAARSLGLALPASLLLQAEVLQ